MAALSLVVVTAAAAAGVGRGGCSGLLSDWPLVFGSGVEDEVGGSFPFLLFRLNRPPALEVFGGAAVVGDTVAICELAAVGDEREGRWTAGDGDDDDDGRKQARALSTTQPNTSPPGSSSPFSAALPTHRQSRGRERRRQAPSPRFCHALAAHCSTCIRRRPSGHPVYSSVRWMIKII